MQVHRINFFEPDPVSINFITYDHSSSRLAVSRANASIEIWDVRGIPYLEKIIPSIPNASVETLAWCNGHLFSAGLNGYIIEYDLTTLTQKYQVLVSTGCPIWCMAANRQMTTLAAGNEDGHVILHDFILGGLDFQKKFDRQEGSILCLAWHKNGHVIVTGSQDAIRVWDVEAGHIINRITLGRATRNTATAVWCIAILRDMTIVSGDSCGKTSFWDGNTGTLLSSKLLHQHDVLALAVSEDEKEIYTSGVDPIIQMFRQSHYNGMWLKCVQRIAHTHDVKTLDLYSNFVVSGGDDCNLVFTKYPPKTTIKFFPFCQMSYITVAPLASCVLLRYANYLELWRIGASPSGSTSSQNLLQIKAKSNEVIICSSVSLDGNWIAYSSQFEIKLYHVNLDSADVPTISKVLLPDDIPNCASGLLFTPDSTKLVLYSKGKFFIIKCNKELITVAGIIDEDTECFGQAHILDVSGNGLYLASGSHDGNVTVYNLTLKKVVSKLPRYKYQPTALKFDPLSENLVVAYSDRKVIEFNIIKDAYSHWSQKQFLETLQHDSYHPITSIVYHSDKLFLSDENCIYAFNITEQLESDRKRAKLSKNSFTGSGEDDTYTSITKYEHISGLYSFNDDLAVVQINQRHIEDALPPPIFKKKYGT